MGNLNKNCFQVLVQLTKTIVRGTFLTVHGDLENAPHSCLQYETLTLGSTMPGTLLGTHAPELRRGVGTGDSDGRF